MNWYGQWYAGMDVNDTSWRDQPAGSNKPLSQDDRDRALRWAEREQRRGLLRRKGR